MCHMLHTLYTLWVFVNYPSIPTDLKALGDDRFEVRATATERLNALPGWTSFYFKYQTQISKDLEVRLRRANVQKTLQGKWDDVLLKRKADLILALFPSIPEDVKTLAGQHRPFDERLKAKIRLEHLPAFTAAYFGYVARKATKPKARSLCERICKIKEKEWKEILTSNNLPELQFTLGKLEARKRLPKLWATIFSNLSKLSPEDLKLVEAQKYCPVHDPGTGPDPLGCEGVPVKITLKGQTVFLCSKERIKKAQADPDKTFVVLKNDKGLSFRTKKQLEQDLEKMFNFMDDK